MYEDRVTKAVELFKEGYNCSQSVVGAFADMYGFTPEQAFRMSSSFGGGIGRMRETCGAACGLFMLAGLETGATKGSDKEGKAANYALVQKLADKLKSKNGSIVCGVLLGLRKSEVELQTINNLSSVPAERTEQYYKKRPCVQLVEQAARLWTEYLEDQMRK
ncbi:MAG: C_GCAxxG_C_C family protein [Bacteroidales bacterium]|nr:C_GCAxxG_C_C family protein [Bacteroidales bacterium]